MSAKNAHGVNEEASLLLIRETAYYHWEGKGRPCGTALDDWLYAEAIISAGPAKATAPASAPVSAAAPAHTAPHALAPAPAPVKTKKIPVKHAAAAK